MTYNVFLFYVKRMNVNTANTTVSVWFGPWNEENEREEKERKKERAESWNRIK